LDTARRDRNDPGLLVGLGNGAVSRLVIPLLLTIWYVAPDPGEAGANQDYPGIIRESAERRTRAEREWQRLLDSSKLASMPPDLYPIIATPRSLPGSGGVPLITTTSEAAPDESTLREAVKLFIDRWRELLGADPAALSLTKSDQVNGEWRFTYRQASYPFRIAGGFGVLTASLSPEGRLLKLDDRLIPLVQVPVNPALDRAAAAGKLIGRTFSHRDDAGNERELRINSADEVNPRQLVILPVEKPDHIEVHLAWEIIAGKSPVFTVFVDAVTGEELKHAEGVEG
jgi:hypothetical protein